MKLNRRNVLVGIGTAAVGSGVALGSGAFTQVQATRTMTVETAGDGSALIQLADEEGGDLVTTTTSGTSNGETVLEINLDNLNDNAVTTIDPAFSITNEMGQGVGVRVTTDAGGATGLDITSSTNGDDITTYPGGSGDDNNLDDSGSVSVALSIDTGELNTDNVSEITVEADTSEYQTT